MAEMVEKEEKRMRADRTARRKTWCCMLAVILCAALAASSAHGRSLIHSHNDYAQKRPFWGALMAYATGREYENVFPLWDDWRMIPGVTAYLGKPVVRKDSRNRRDDIRAGTRGDGGFFEFTFEREGLVAHKKWTFSPDGIVCEGSGISASDGAYEVATCVEHAWGAPDAGVVEQSDGRVALPQRRVRVHGARSEGRDPLRARGARGELQHVHARARAVAREGQGILPAHPPR